MNKKIKSEHITPVDVNIFVDLGFEKNEAELLLAEADRRINDKLAIKLTLCWARSKLKCNIFRKKMFHGKI